MGPVAAIGAIAGWGIGGTLAAAAVGAVAGTLLDSASGTNYEMPAPEIPPPPTTPTPPTMPVPPTSGGYDETRSAATLAQLSRKGRLATILSPSGERAGLGGTVERLGG